MKVLGSSFMCVLGIEWVFPGGPGRAGMGTAFGFPGTAPGMRSTQQCTKLCEPWGQRAAASERSPRRMFSTFVAPVSGSCLELLNLIFPISMAPSAAEESVRDPYN
jgi:hypothetical protein